MAAKLVIKLICTKRLSNVSFSPESSDAFRKPHPVLDNWTSPPFLVQSHHAVTQSFGTERDLNRSGSFLPLRYISSALRLSDNSPTSSFHWSASPDERPKSEGLAGKS
jgi:hypothetical protein